jgi:serine/threonine-protein kinase HipA
MKQLQVYMNDTPAGVLTEEHPGRGYTFAYDASYLASDWPPVSLTLPKRQEEYTSEYLFPAFANILPEGQNRKFICRVFHIDERDLFSLLYTMADGEFVGALNVRKIKE